MAFNYEFLSEKIGLHGKNTDKLSNDNLNKKVVLHSFFVNK